MRKNILLLLVLLAIITSCGKQSKTTENSNQTINFWTMSLSPTFDDYINSVIGNFEAANPNVTVEWTDVAWGEMEVKILTSVAGKTAPDVVNLNPQFAAKLAVESALVDIEDYLSTEEQNAYFEGLYRSNSYQGKIFALPWYITNTIAIFNTNLYKQAGVNIFRSYDEILDVARKIKESTGQYTYFPAFDGTMFLESLASSGIPLVRDGKAAFNTPETRKFIDLYVTLFQEQLIPSEVLTGGHEKAREMYMAGSVATLLSGPTMLGPIKNDAPDIYAVTDVAPAPKSAAGGYTNAAIMNIALPVQQSDKNYAAAAKFAAFITNAANQTEFAKTAGTILSSAKASLADPYFQNSDGSVEAKARMLAAEQLAESKALIPPVDKLSTLNEDLISNVQKAMLGEISTQEALDQAEAQWNETLEDVEYIVNF